jgi:hypothetical protein
MQRIVAVQCGRARTERYGLFMLLQRRDARFVHVLFEYLKVPVSHRNLLRG